MTELSQDVPDPCTSLSALRYGRDGRYNRGNGVQLRESHVIRRGRVEQYLRRDGDPTRTFDSELGHDDGHNLRRERNGEHVCFEPRSHGLRTPVVPPLAAAPSEVEASFVDIRAKIEMLTANKPRRRNEVVLDSDGEPLSFEQDPLSHPVGEEFTEQKVDIELHAEFGPTNGLTEPDGSSDRPVAPTGKVIPIPPVSRSLEQSRDVREKLLVIQGAGKSELVRVGVEGLGELVGTIRDELAQVVRSCFGNSQELRELPKKLTLRAHYAAQELNRADRRPASRSW
jgi:hypothetical protein